MVVVKAKEVHEKYFEGIAGNEVKAKPLIDFYSKLKEKSSKTESVLSNFIKLMASLDFSDEDKEQNVLARLLDKHEVTFKNLKESNIVAGSFDKSKKMRQ